MLILYVKSLVDINCTYNFSKMWILNSTFAEDTVHYHLRDKIKKERTSKCIYFLLIPVKY